jgi:prolyl-tRNA synthetase
MGKEIPTRAEDYSSWYNELVKKADLAEHSDVRGCMVIKPYGYSIWEKMQQGLDKMFKDTGHVNAYFPLFVPKSMFEAEEQNGLSVMRALTAQQRQKTILAEDLPNEVFTAAFRDNFELQYAGIGVAAQDDHG